MNILIDTNIFIPLELTSLSDVEPETHAINELYRKAKEIDCHVFLLGTQKKDVENDKNPERNSIRLLAFEKYELLENVKTTEIISTAFPNIPENSHDFIDVALLNALCANAVSILVTNDEGIHKKAKKIGKEDFVYYLADALDFINSQLPHNLKVDVSHPVIKSEKCYNIDINDTFFDSLRTDYDGEKFNNWFKEKCQNGHRDCLVIQDNNKLVGLCIYKFEEPCYEMSGTVLKICTFNLSVSGNKQGELLLRKLFDYSYSSNVDWIYVTAYEKNYICQFFENFGFEKYSKLKDDTGEFIFRKRMKPRTSDYTILSPLEFDIKFGPRYFNDEQDAFLVPVISSYHNMLFPESIKENLLFPQLDYMDSFSNAMRKAYLCKSNSTLVREGSILFFYKSHDMGTIETCGIVERVERLQNPDEIISVTGKRTVYQREEIKTMCSYGKNILVLLFRQAESFPKEIKFSDLQKQNLVSGIPQSITKLTEEAKKWILQQRQF
ncbi:MAG: hypothetical protein IJ158_08755 [Treponema sp.]|nr:hypothetical protein [Treponema sp.]